MQCSLNPYADYAYDGLFLNPLEVVFVKVKRFQREANWGSARLADAYSGWMDQEVRPIACFIADFLTCDHTYAICIAARASSHILEHA